MVSAGMTEHLKRLSADTDEVILATCALAAARTAGRAPVAGGGELPVGSAAGTRELEKEVATEREKLRGHEPDSKNDGPGATALLGASKRQVPVCSAR